MQLKHRLNSIISLILPVLVFLFFWHLISLGIIVVEKTLTTVTQKFLLNNLGTYVFFHVLLDLLVDSFLNHFFHFIVFICSILLHFPFCYKSVKSYKAFFDGVFQACGCRKRDWKLKKHHSRRNWQFSARFLSYFKQLTCGQLRDGIS